MALCSIFLSLPGSASAYSSPFRLTDPAVPGQVNAAAEVRYSLREGGTYIYCNNPEALYSENIGKALMIEEDLHGDVFFSNENQNRTGRSILTGLQVRNHSGAEIQVTVMNIGYQVGIDWNGQVEWTDFFNTRFRVEEGTGNYAFSKEYDPKPFEEQTYAIPDGEYFYVMGGSTKDAYGNIDVGGTANKYWSPGTVVNGAVYFRVDGPETGVSAAYVIYESADKPVTADEQQGYVVERDGQGFGRQYLGSAPYLCAESAIAWNIDDSFADGRKLPVKYKVNYFADTANYGAYGEYTGKPLVRTMSGTSWFTHINSSNHNEYIGTDMMPFYCVTEDGTPVVIDIYHNDGTGKPANIGNWMVVYEESLTFQNSGSLPREFSLYIKNNGVLAVTVRDDDGNAVDSLYHFNASLPVCSVNVPAGTVRTLHLEYVLLANSYGSLEHYVTAQRGKEEAELMLGDVNGNGKIDAQDYVMVKRAVFGTYTLGSSQVKAADVNGDGLVNAKDYLMIKRHVLGTYAVKQD